MKKILQYIGIFLLLGILFYSILFFRPYRVEGDSMLGFLKNESVVIINTGYFVIYRGNIVVYAKDGEIPRIKRAIGLGGETIEISDGDVLIESQKVSEDYLNPKTRTCVPGSCIDLSSKKYSIPENNYFVLGDNRENSRDSRGCQSATLCEEKNAYFVSKKNIIGKYLFTLPSFF